MRLVDKVALITGGICGIGRAIAQLFAREGALVYTIDVSTAATNQNEPDDTQTPHAICNLRADVTNHESLMAALAGIHGRIDILVNNAGINTHPAALAET